MKYLVFVQSISGHILATITGSPGSNLMIVTLSKRNVIVAIYHYFEYFFRDMVVNFNLLKFSHFDVTRAYIFPFDQKSCYIFSKQNNYCEFFVSSFFQPLVFFFTSFPYQYRMLSVRYFCSQKVSITQYGTKRKNDLLKGGRWHSRISL